MRIFNVEETAERTRLSRRSLYDRRFRARAGLRAVKLGLRRIGFEEEELNRFIARGRERLPGEGR